MPPGKMHSLLKRQLKRCFGDSFAVPGEWSAFLDMVDSAYHESDMDRNMLERSMELSSQELLQSNSEMRAIFEAVPDIFFRIDASGIILDCKTGNTSDLLLSREDLIGNRIFEIPSAPVADKFRKALGHVRRTNAGVSFEYSLPLGGVENFYEARFIPLLEDQSIIIIRNITDRKDAEEALRASEEYYRAIFENTATANLVIGEDTTILKVNNNLARLVGYTKQELEGKMSWMHLIHKDDLEWMKNYHKMRRQDPRSAPSSYEFRLVNRRGEVKELFMNIDVVPQTSESIASLTDLTERKHLERQLVQAQKMESVGPAGRRRRPRLQQHAQRDHRQYGAGHGTGSGATSSFTPPCRRS